MKQFVMFFFLLFFYDISKTFGRVWHRGLIHKLKKIWNLRRSLRLDSKLSVYAEPKSICQWHFLIIILAGSPGSSFFFLIHINDLADYLHGMVRLFADDISLSFSSNSLALI